MTAQVSTQDFATLLEERLKRQADGKIGGNGPAKAIEHKVAGKPIKGRRRTSPDWTTFTRIDAAHKN